MTTGKAPRITASRSQPVSHSGHAGRLLQRKCACGAPTSALTDECQDCTKAKRQGVQAKLTVSGADDSYEREADRTAEQVTRPDALQTRRADPVPVRRTASTGMHHVPTDADSGVDEVLRSPGEPLDRTTRDLFEARFGHAFDRVRVNTGAAAVQSTRALHARAYTVGSHIAFAPGEYQPHAESGRRLLAHELTHVLQQGETGTHRAPQLQKADAADAPPAHNYKSLAAKIYDAIAGPGTDEEAVYRALQTLDRDPAAIKELERVYLSEYRLSLLDDIYDDFGGEELEYALQLMNLGTKGSKQRIAAAPSTPLDLDVAVQRLRDAVEGAGTDEEAIFAVLVPFKRNTLALQERYQRLFHEDLRDRLVDELGGAPLDNALELLETPYEHYLHEGNEKLAGAPFGSFGDVSTFCFPEEKETSEGPERIYWYDKEYWEPDVKLQEGRPVCAVKLLSDKSAAKALDEMFDHQGRWKIACAEFVQIVHLYALRHTLGSKQFDQRVSTGGFRLEVQRRQSTGVVTEVTFARTAPSEQMTRSDTGKPDPRGVDAILAAAPVGSRVRWTNLSGVGENGPNPWEHENTIKLGPNTFAAHGTGSSNRHTRQEVELLTARGSNPKADANYVKKNIFISQIETFRDPSRAA